MSTPNLPAEVPAAKVGSDLVSAEAMLAPFSARAVPRYATNIDVSSEWGAALASQLRAGAAKELDAAAGGVIDVTYWIAHVVPVTTDDGEVLTRPRVILSDTQGRAYAWTGETATRYWTDILAMKGLGPWEPPLRVLVNKVKSRRTAGHFYTLSLEMPVRQEEQEPKVHKPPKK